MNFGFWNQHCNFGDQQGGMDQSVRESSVKLAKFGCLRLADTRQDHYPKEEVQMKSKALKLK